ncbi:MAG: hypothetical protein HY360_15160 [Verrucomicrobia bacterium]|nr:hypothetical protein [Verrucomicrobiota bacterium]
MKREAYFTAESLMKKTEEWLRVIAAWNCRVRRFCPESSALLIVDMQRFFEP